METTKTKTIRPYLLQRLKTPYKIEHPLCGAFSFGGGMKNGGLSEEFYGYLKELWRYDYMGSAEFEFGALPKSFQRIVANQPNLTKFQFECEGVRENWRTTPTTTVRKVKTVYVVCKKEDVDAVKEAITKVADEKKRDFRTKESVCLAGNIVEDEYSLETCGWHDIENDYLFFTDKRMFDGLCTLFDVK